MTPYETDLAHLITMASIPGFKEHAWHQAKRLDACSTGMWAGIADALVAAMRERAAKASKTTQGASKSKTEGRA